MPGFLQEVAADLYDRYGDDISSLSVLFPSRRARLFFIDALSGIAERPLWQPRWTTIDELMSEISGLRIGDRVRHHFLIGISYLGQDADLKVPALDSRPGLGDGHERRFIHALRLRLGYQF